MNASNLPEENESFSGMTVNERLVVAGSIDQFDAAARGRDRQAMIALLLAVQLDDQQAAHTTDSILSNPRQYGY